MERIRATLEPPRRVPGVQGGDPAERVVVASRGLGGAVGSEEEQDFLGIPGLLDAEQVSALLRQRQAEQIQRRPRAQAAEPADVVDHRRMKELRSELSKTVSAWAARSGQPHGVIHNRLREISGGPAVAQASREQLEKRLSTLRGWFVGRT